MSDKKNRQPDELDALLQRIDEKEQLEQQQQQQQGYGGLANISSSSIASMSGKNSAGGGSHRKAHSLFAGGRGIFNIGGGGGNGADSKASRRNRHRKNKSSISELYDAIRSVDLQPIREDIVSTSQTIKETFVTELEEMDRGHIGFFDMGMTRSLSVLPEDMANLAMEAGDKPQPESPRKRRVKTFDPADFDTEKQQQLQQQEEEVTQAMEDASKNTVWFQYFSLFFAVFAVSSKSTGFHMLHGVDAPMKQYWKMTASWIVMSPMALHYCFQPQEKGGGIPKLSFMGWLTFAAAIACYAAQNVLFVTSLDYTMIGNAVIFANSQALLLIVGKVLVGESIHLLEGIGVFIAFSGAILCSQDADHETSEDGTGSNGRLGDALALCSAIAGVSYFTFAKSVRKGVSVSLFVWSVMFLGSFFILFFMMISPDIHIEFSMDPNIGVFGWLNIHRLPILIYLAVVCNMVGTMGFVRAMAYFENIVIAVATLTEPLMASLIAFVCQVGLLPGPMGWIGNLLVVIGTLAVVYPSMGKGGSSSGH